MVLALPFPDWVPAWVHVAALCVGALFAISFLLLPFAVFGIKGRLEMIEARLDELQGEIRSLSLRLPEPLADMAHDNELFASGRHSDRPPIPPAPRGSMGHDRVLPATMSGPSAKQAPARSVRTEPRLY